MLEFVGLYCQGVSLDDVSNLLKEKCDDKETHETKNSLKPTKPSMQYALYFQQFSVRYKFFFEYLPTSDELVLFPSLCLQNPVLKKVYFYTRHGTI